VEVTPLHAALIVVDVQRDFCPGGALAVKDGDEVVPRINNVIDAFGRQRLPVFFTRDWHPRNHISFKKQGGPWPPHCVQGTPGAEFHPSLKVPLDVVIISKGNDPAREAYSGFQGTDLESRLKSLGVREVFVAGLATDYCVKESASDARRAGFEVTIIEDCVRPVNVRPGDGAQALAAMRKEGAKSTTSSALVRLMAGAQQ
jgi:nicotinamidase/pyrazinamidase